MQGVEDRIKRIAAILLAAGSSSRMGRPKLLLPFGDQSMLQVVMEKITHLPLAEILVVVGAYRDLLVTELRGMDERIRILVNEEYGMGQSGSIRRAVSAWNEWEGVMIFLADMPFIKNETIQKVYLEGIAQFRHTKEPFVLYPERAGKAGHPVFFGGFGKEDFTSLTGDVGAKPLLQKAKRKIPVPVEDAGIHIDLDTPEDWERYKGMGR